MKEPTSTKTADMQPAVLLGISPHGNSSSIPEMNGYFKENPWMAASKYTITIKVRILFAKFTFIFTGNNIVITFKIQ